MKAVKPKVGRPATGRDPLVGIRLPQATLDQIDAWALDQKTTRSKTIRGLIDAAITVGGLSKPEPVQAPRAPKVATPAATAEKAAQKAEVWVSEFVQFGPTPVKPGDRLKKR
jgi:nucleoid-associated protein YgaU